MQGEGTKVEYLPPPSFLPPRGEGGRDFYPDDFLDITTMKTVNLKLKIRVIGAEEWMAVVTLHPPHLSGVGEVTHSGGGEFDLSTYFNSHHLHIPSKPYINVFHSFET